MRNLLLTMFIFVAILFLGACSEETLETPVEEPEVEAEAPAEAPEAEEAAAPAEPVVAEEPAEDPAVTAYADSITTILGTFGETMYTFSELNSQAGEDPSVMFSEDWQMEVVVSLQLMDMLIDQTRQLDAPPTFQQTHELVLLSMDEYEFVVDNYPSAIDNMDVDLLEQCIAAIEAGTQYMDSAASSIQ